MAQEFKENLSPEQFESFASQSPLGEKKELSSMSVASPPDPVCASNCLNNHRDDPQGLKECIKACDNPGQN
jgi:hypothetical protein